jgi:hypothetical protein
MHKRNRGRTPISPICWGDLQCKWRCSWALYLESAGKRWGLWVGH